ncbi:MAG: biotin--[acetyl-CoA-carboxylase] ligase [Spirochaetales bacterium]|nr:biotin--[acetyl-CoA-carboxylase] ligase [Spirochaetales bacterium]
MSSIIREMTNSQYGYHILTFDELDSTNRYATDNADSLNDRDIVMTEIQTSGRGRFDRVWVSDVPDNISCTIVLKPTGDYTALPIGNLTQYAAVYICHLLERYGQTPKIKWPNDVKVGGKKISGILTRTLFSGMTLKATVVGIGINVNQSQTLLDSLSQPATAFNLLCGHHIDRDKLLTELLDTFFTDYSAFMQGGFDFIRNEYMSHWDALGQPLTVRTIGGTFTGTAIDIDQAGALMLETSDGIKHLLEGES